jgi:hypothetical protein
MTKKKRKSNIEKYWEKTKKLAKATQKEVQAIGKAATKVGTGLSASGNVVQEAFRPSSFSQKYPNTIRYNCEMCGRRLALPQADPTRIAVCQRCMKGQKEEFYVPRGYKKKLGFGWGGF